MNHFIPIWKAERLSAEQRERLNDDLVQEVKSLERIESTPGKGAQVESMRQAATDRINFLQRFQTLQDWLWSGGGYMAAEVPADGNCCVWSLLALEHHDPFIVPSKRIAECKKLRAEIADCWGRVCDDPDWQQLFNRLLHLILPDMNVDLPPPSPSKQIEPIATPVRKRLQSLAPNSKPSPKQKKASPKQKKLSAPPEEKVTMIGSRRPACNPRRSPAEAFAFSPEPKEKQKSSQNLKEHLESVPDLDDLQKKKKNRRRKADKEKGDKDEKDVAKPKKKRNRTCKKKEKTDEDKQEDIVKTYLASLGITWFTHQKFHAQRGLSSERGAGDVSKCKQFAMFKSLFVEGDMPDCDACVAMLADYGFDMETLQQSLKGNPGSAGMERWKKLRQEWSATDLPSFDDGAADVELSSCTDLVLYDPDVAQGQAASDQDPFAILKENPFLQLLPLNTHDRRVPIRCRVCKSRKQPLGKVFEAHAVKANVVENFVHQHCVRPGHLANLARWVQNGTGDPGLSGDRGGGKSVPCVGMSLTMDGSRFGQLRSELMLWARMCKLSAEFGKHRYVVDMGREDLTVFHESCDKVVKEQLVGTARAVCKKCQDWRLGCSASQSAVRFSIKYWGAKLLQARLFKSEEVVQSLIQEMKSRSLYQQYPTKVDDVCAMSLFDLQDSLRKSWLKVRRDTFTPQLTEFVEQVVRQIDSNCIKLYCFHLFSVSLGFIWFCFVLLEGWFFYVLL